MKRDLELEATIVEKYAAVEAVLDERGRRRWAAAESRAIGFGGDSLVSAATGLSRPTIRAGRREIEAGIETGERIRRPGAAPKYRKLSAGRAGSSGAAGRPVDTWRPMLTVAMDVQEQSKANGRSGKSGMAGEFDNSRTTA